MWLPPAFLLAALCLLPLLAVGVDGHRRRGVGMKVRALGTDHQLHYSAQDRLRLTPRVAAALPTPGAAAVRVMDVLYGTHDGRHRYIFTVEYSVGVARQKRRVRQVATFAEPRDRSAPAEPLRVAPAELPVLEQYRLLTDQGFSIDAREEEERRLAGGPAGG